MENHYHLRKAEEKDCKLLFDWANEKQTRQASFQTGTIQWSEHESWFFQKLAHPHTQLYILQDGQKTPLGQVRLDHIFQDHTLHHAVISVSVDLQKRQKGLGTKLIQLGSETFRKAFPHVPIYAYIKASNVGSIRAFQNAGYVQDASYLDAANAEKQLFILS